MKSLKRTAIALMAAILVSFLASGPNAITAGATTTTRQEIEDKEQEKNQLEGQLDEVQENLDNLKDERNTLNGQLDTLNSQLTAVSDRLEELERKIEDKEQEIADTQAALAEAKEKEDWQYDSMVIRVRDMYEYGGMNYVSAILNAGSFSDIVTAADYFEQISAYSQIKLEEFRENHRLIAEQEARLLADMAELESLQVEVLAEQGRVSGLISQTSNSIAQYANQISDAEKEALAYEERIRKAEEDLTVLRQKLAEEIAMSRAAANASWRDISEVTFAEGDLYLLANLIYCEAGGEPYEGQLAVGSVVINRVLSSVYPDTVVGVIYQNRQFSPVASGRLALALAENRATDRCYQAAEEAMSGVTNVGNCVYFRTPVEGLTGINIGGHVFY